MPAEFTAACQAFSCWHILRCQAITTKVTASLTPWCLPQKSLTFAACHTQQQQQKIEATGISIITKHSHAHTCTHTLTRHSIKHVVQALGQNLLWVKFTFSLFLFIIYFTFCFWQLVGFWPHICLVTFWLEYALHECPCVHTSSTRLSLACSQDVPF